MCPQTNCKLNSNLYDNPNPVEEYYTQIQDIEAECINYDWKNKWVFLPADGLSSAFWLYFQEHFFDLGLRQLTAIKYVKDGNGLRYDMNYLGQISSCVLTGTGDMNSPYSLDIAKRCSIVVTNPPFSLATEYTIWLLKNQIKFLLVLPATIYCRPRIWYYLTREEIYDGVTNTNSSMQFIIPSNSKEETRQKKGIIKRDGLTFARINAGWVTNLLLSATGQRYIKPFNYTAVYSPDLYSKFDNYDAIYIRKLIDIPEDYNGLMGVPITYAHYYDLSKFRFRELKAIKFRYQGKRTFQRMVISKTTEEDLQNDKEKLRNEKRKRDKHGTEDS